MSGYALLDAGDGRKLERFGPYFLDRPAPQALWKSHTSPAQWDRVEGRFERKGSQQHWSYLALPECWEVTVEGITLELRPTEFGHLGFFPEHKMIWRWLSALSPSDSFLNLFAYSGGATLVAAVHGVPVCHVDSSRGMVEWARKNALLNGLEEAPIRWIVDDAHAFLRREVARGRTYRAILLDPPSFGRGAKGQVFKAQRDLVTLLELCGQLFDPEGRFFCITSHTPGFTPLLLEQLLQQTLSAHHGECSSGELFIPAESGLSLPSGAYARWENLS